VRVGSLGVRGFADVVKIADVRMIEGCDSASLAIESLAPVGVSRTRLQEDLDRDETIESGVVRPVHFAHAAGPKESIDAIRA
jgi:hypothetical protein